MPGAPSRLARTLCAAAICALGALLAVPATAAPKKKPGVARVRGASPPDSPPGGATPELRRLRSGVAASARHKKKQHKKKAKPGVRAVARKKAPPPPLPPLDGVTYDYDYDGKDVGHRERRWLGRVFVHRKAAELSGQALPVLVFLHGLNNERIKYRWMGGGAEGDVRRIVSEMIEAGQVPPLILAAPSSVDPYTMSNAGAAWPGFDLDNFLDRTQARLGTAAYIDRGRVVVAAHSGGGCNIRGGLNTALHPQATPVLAGISIDTCMLLDLAKSLAHLRPTTHVVVTWQSISWPDREFGAFKTLFLREAKKAPPGPGILRELDAMQPRAADPHDAMVGLTLRKWLPRILPPPPQAATAPPPAAAPAGG